MILAFGSLRLQCTVTAQSGGVADTRMDLRVVDERFWTLTDALQKWRRLQQLY